MTWPTQVFVVVKDESQICLFVVLVNVKRNILILPEFCF